jgi:hypothetical protein
MRRSGNMAVQGSTREWRRESSDARRSRSETGIADTAMLAAHNEQNVIIGVAPALGRTSREQVQAAVCHHPSNRTGRGWSVFRTTRRCNFKPSYEMKKNSPDDREWHERQIEKRKQEQIAPEPTDSGAHGKPVKGGAPESRGSRETFPKRTKKPGSAGLANEVRPGLGTRADYADPSPIPDQPPKEATSKSKPEATPRGYEEPRKEPREQPPDSLAHEQERSTGVSGHSGNT